MMIKFALAMAVPLLVAACTPNLTNQADVPPAPSTGHEALLPASSPAASDAAANAGAASDEPSLPDRKWRV